MYFFENFLATNIMKASLLQPLSSILYVSMNTIKVVFAFANSADADCYLFTTQLSSFYKENFLLMKSLKKFEDITWEIFGIPNSIHLIMQKCAIACH